VPAKIAFLPLASGFPDLVGHHRNLLDDGVRTKSFIRAIEKVVKRGDVVADLGAGTGVLAIAARRAGAKKVYAIERGPIARIGAALTEENGVSGIEWIEKWSRDVVLPESVDVIVSECFGVLAAGGTMLQAVDDLARRHLRARGRVIPRSAAIFAAPVEAPAEHRWVGHWNAKRYGMTFHVAAELAWNNVYNATFRPRALCSAPMPVAQVDFGSGWFAGAGVTKIARAGTVHGLAVWFDGDLAPGVTLSTAPGTKSTAWNQVFLPFARPIRARVGADVSIALRMEPANVDRDVAYLDWSGAIGGATFDGSTRRSYPTTRPSTRRTPRFESSPLPTSS
jgi:precorrin-6B methylase 2